MEGNPARLFWVSDEPNQLVEKIGHEVEARAWMGAYAHLRPAASAYRKPPVLVKPDTPVYAHRTGSAGRKRGVRRVGRSAADPLLAGNTGLGSAAKTLRSQDIGQALTADRARTTTRSPSIAMPSTTRPAGTKLAGRNRCFIMLIPLGNQRQNSSNLQRN